MDTSRSSIFQGLTTNFSFREMSSYAEKHPLNFMLAYQNGELDCSNQSYNLNVSAMKEVCYPPNVVFFSAICMILLDMISMAGNFVSALALSRTKRLRRVTTAFIVNLCVSDFFHSFFTFICAVNVLRTKLLNGGSRYCKWYNFLDFFFASASVSTVAAIAVNRYVSIVHPRCYRAIFSKRNTGIIISLLWAKSLAIILLPHFEVWGKFEYDSEIGECAHVGTDGRSDVCEIIVSYFIPLFLFSLCYSTIFYVVRKSESKFSICDGSALKQGWRTANYSTGSANDEPAKAKLTHRQNDMEWRLSKMISAIFVFYVLCFVPISVMKLLRKEIEYPRLYILSHLGQNLSSVVNPIIYIVMSEEYRKAFKELVHGKTGRNKVGRCLSAPDFMGFNRTVSLDVRSRSESTLNSRSVLMNASLPNTWQRHWESLRS